MRINEDELVYTWDNPEKPHDRIVVIGNGFDLECGLPTAYHDFISFIQLLESVHEQQTAIDFALLRRFAKKYGPNPLPFAQSGLTSDADVETGASRIHSLVSSPYVPIDYIILLRVLEAQRYNKSNRSLIVKDMLTEEDFFQQWSPMFDNYWYRLFKKANTGNGWVDFEAAIATVIRYIEGSMASAEPYKATIDDHIEHFSEGLISTLSDLYSLVEELLSASELTNSLFIRHTDMHQKLVEYLRSKNVTYRRIRTRLLDDLNLFIECFETYLRRYVDRLDAKKTPAVEYVVNALRDVQSRSDTLVITFNYTKTLEKMLQGSGIDIPVCYVHGRISDSKEKSRLVMGMDEYLDEDSVREMTDFAMFRKYNQRIFKRADTSYALRLADIELWNGGEHGISHAKRFSQCDAPTAVVNRARWKHEVIVMGHSLGTSDHDLLRRVFILPNTRVSVYYHSDDHFSELLANTTAMMGKDFLIERTASDRCTLKFVDQREL